MTAIFKREFKSYLRNVSGFVFIAVFLCVIGISTSIMNLLLGFASFEYALSQNIFFDLLLVFLIIIPLLTMRVIAEERHNRTDQLLYSLPVSMTSIVIAKYLAMLCVFLIPIAVICLYPIALSYFGIVNYATAYNAILGLFLLGASLIAIGTFLSSLTESQIIAAVASFGTLLLFYLMSLLTSILPATALVSFLGLVLLSALLAVLVYLLTKNFNVAVIVAGVCVVPLCIIYMINASLFTGLLPEVLSFLAVFDRFRHFASGVFDLTAVIYYLSVTVFFLFLTVQAMEKRRWS